MGLQVDLTLKGQGSFFGQLHFQCPWLLAEAFGMAHVRRVDATEWPVTNHSVNVIGVTALGPSAPALSSVPGQQGLGFCPCPASWTPQPVCLQQSSRGHVTTLLF